MPACSFEVSAIDKNQIIIGTAGVKKDLAYNYVKEALENGFYNIDTSADYNNEEEVGRSIRDFENKSEYNHAYVISKFSLSEDFGNTVFISDSLIETQILFETLNRGAEIFGNYPIKRSIVREVPKILTILYDKEKILEISCKSYRILKSKNTIVIK